MVRWIRSAALLLGFLVVPAMRGQEPLTATPSGQTAASTAETGQSDAKGNYEVRKRFASSLFNKQRTGRSSKSIWALTLYLPRQQMLPGNKPSCSAK